MHCSVELLFQLYIEVINWKDYKINCTVQIVVGMENRAHSVGNRRQSCGCHKQSKRIMKLRVLDMKRPGRGTERQQEVPIPMSREPGREGLLLPRILGGARWYSVIPVIMTW